MIRSEAEPQGFLCERTEHKNPCYYYSGLSPRKNTNGSRLVLGVGKRRLVWQMRNYGTQNGFFELKAWHQQNWIQGELCGHFHCLTTRARHGILVECIVLLRLQCQVKTNLSDSKSTCGLYVYYTSEYMLVWFWCQKMSNEVKTTLNESNTSVYLANEYVGKL